MGDPNVSELCVYDLTIAMVPPAGVAADLSHMNHKCKVKGYAFDKDDKAINVAGECLTGCNLVMVPAGVPRKPGQDRKDLLNINCGIAKNIVEACAKYCPNAIIALIVNPVNSVVPAMAELWAKKGLDPMKIVGVTTLDCVRAEKLCMRSQASPLRRSTFQSLVGMLVPLSFLASRRTCTRRQLQGTRFPTLTRRHRMQVP